MSYKSFFYFAQDNPFTKFDSFSSNISVYEHANTGGILRWLKKTSKDVMSHDGICM